MSEIALENTQLFAQSNGLDFDEFRSGRSQSRYEKKLEQS